MSTEGIGVGDRIGDRITIMYKDDEDRVSEEESAAPTDRSNPTAEKNPHSSEDGGRPSSSDGASKTFTPPNGGFEAWLLVLAGFLVFSNTWYVILIHSIRTTCRAGAMKC